jgi:hypothetical protein
VRTTRCQRFVRSELSRLAAIALAVTFVLGVVRAGARYFYCPIMDAVVSAHCCPRADADRTESPALVDDECCDVRTNAALPAGTAAAPAPELAAAPLLALLPAPSALDAGTRVVASHAMHAYRTGPPAIAHARERVARSMVALI